MFGIGRKTDEGDVVSKMQIIFLMAIAKSVGVKPKELAKKVVEIMSEEDGSYLAEFTAEFGAATAEHVRKTLKDKKSKK